MKLGRIAIIGSGAVGSYYGARLAQAGEDVTFLLRSDYDYVRENGLHIESIHGDFQLNPVQCARDSKEIGEVDLVIIAWKTTSNHYAEEIIRPLVGENTIILTLQNGLANCELLAKLFGAERIIGGLCFVCINRLSSGHISHTASGLIRLGEFYAKASKRVDQIAKVFREANIRCESVESLEKALWMKLVWNYPFNGLAIAEGGVDTEVLLNDLKLEPLIRTIMQEILSIAAALGHDIPESFIDQQIEITYPMKAYRPSSMIDYVEGRPVEYEAIWENPLKVAEQLDIPVPEMKKLSEKIRERLNLMEKR